MNKSNHPFVVYRIVRNKLSDKKPEDGSMTSLTSPTVSTAPGLEGDRTATSYSINGILGIPKHIEKRPKREVYGGKFETMFLTRALFFLNARADIDL